MKLPTSEQIKNKYFSLFLALKQNKIKVFKIKNYNGLQSAPMLYNLKCLKLIKITSVDKNYNTGYTEVTVVPDTIGHDVNEHLDNQLNANLTGLEHVFGVCTVLFCIFILCMAINNIVSQGVIRKPVYFAFLFYLIMWLIIVLVGKWVEKKERQYNKKQLSRSFLSTDLEHNGIKTYSTNVKRILNQMYRVPRA